MMKKILLLAAVVLVMSTAGAQVKNKTEFILAGANTSSVVQTKATPNRIAAKKSLGPVNQHLQIHPVKISDISTTQEMKMSDLSSRPSAAAHKAPNRATRLYPHYIRPAGMYSATFLALDGVGLYSFDSDLVFLMAKPFAAYTWEGTALGADGSTNYAWDLMRDDDVHYVDYRSSITFSPAADTIETVPIFYAVDGRLDDTNAIWYKYQIESVYRDHYTDSIIERTPAVILSAENDQAVSRLMGENYIPLYSSKTMVPNYQGYILTRYYGAEPWGDNEYGWWFGKNASHVDGMAQAFEKPQHPYLLNKVYLQAYFDMVVNAPVKLNCKVYKLDGIPDYLENGSVELPEEPGELICFGEATVTPTTGDALNGLITFTLYVQDDLEPNLTYEYSPIIDYPILVCVDGYNDPGMEDLVDFSAFISNNFEVDEGYGELAYLKRGLSDPVCNDQGDTIDWQFNGEYVWTGLNNYFSNIEIKAGLSIFIGTDNPYIIFANEQEDGEYLFGSNGGALRKTWLDGTSTTGIQFLSSYSSDDLWMTWNGTDDLPDWLNINLQDTYDSNGEFTGVLAKVTASRLPSSMTYREAVIRFEIPGDYIEYKFMQGTQPLVLRGDVNTDGQVNISDVTNLIDILLNGTPGGPTADVNADSQVNISDVTYLIDILLGAVEPAQIVSGNRTFTVNGVTFKMMAVEGGTFAMGATRNQSGGNVSYNEKPVHLVTLSDYYIGQTEVTQALWQAVMGSNPSNFTGDLKRPVEMVSWNQCQQFISKLNQMTGMNFRMPTEAEWEFAARGGNKSMGNMYAGSNFIDDVAWYIENANSTTHPVGTKKPNELGIYDMSGNIYEYCQCGYADYPSEPQFNPTGPETDTSRIIRGGSIDYADDYCRISRRWYDYPNSKWKDQGLRLAL